MNVSPTAERAFRTMERCLADAFVELFAAYGIPVTPAIADGEIAPGPFESCAAAVIGYAGERVRGALVLVASKPAIHCWTQAMGGRTVDGDVCDVLGEFSNMLLGRLKAHLLPEGFPILLSTPVAAFGSQLTLARPSGPSRWLGFTGPSWKVETRIDAAFEQGFALQPPADRAEALEPGNLMIL